MKKFLLIIISLGLCGCAGFAVKESYNKPTEKINKKILNKLTIENKNKDIFSIKGNSHKDPNFNGNLIRQEYSLEVEF